MNTERNRVEKAKQGIYSPTEAAKENVNNQHRRSKIQPQKFKKMFKKTRTKACKRMNDPQKDD